MIGRGPVRRLLYESQHGCTAHASALFLAACRVVGAVCWPVSWAVVNKHCVQLAWQSASCLALCVNPAPGSQMQCHGLLHVHVAAANNMGADAEPGAWVQMYSFRVLPDSVCTTSVTGSVCSFVLCHKTAASLMIR